MVVRGTSLAYAGRYVDSHAHRRCYTAYPPGPGYDYAEPYWVEAAFHDNWEKDR